MKRIVVNQPGGPEAMELVDAPAPVAGAGEVVIALAASGVNFIDVYFRNGLYKAPPPIVLGNEGAGTVSQVGSGVTGLAVGDRVAYTMVRGSYAEQVVVPARSVVKIPDAVSFETAAAVMLQGTTAHYLTTSTFPLKAGQTCLIHAAAGGLGGLLVQMARNIGARTIGTVSTEAKAREARSLGCDEVILYTSQDFGEETRRLTDGRGVDVVYDSVGQATFDTSLQVVRPRGMMVLIGQSSGPVPPFDPQRLNAAGSLFLTRPSLGHYLADREELEWRVSAVMQAIVDGALTVRVSEAYPLSRVADAHRALESRATTGKLVILM